MLKAFRVAALSIALLSGLVACSDNSDNNDDQSNHSQSYLQLYHGANSQEPVRWQLNDMQAIQLNLGQASSLRTLDSGEHEFSLTSAHSQQILQEDSITLQSGYKRLLILADHEGEPEVLEVAFDRNITLDQQFMLTLTNLSHDFPELDVYLGQADETFEQAELLERLSPMEVAYPADKHARGHYQLFLTKPGQQQVLFQSQSFHFQYNSTYSLVVRDRQSPVAEQLVVDLVLNSSATDQLLHRAAPAQFRLFNTMQPVQILLDQQPELSLDQHQISDYLSLPQGDYQLSALDDDAHLLLSNQLLSLQHGESKVVVLYQDSAGETRNLQYQEANRPQLHQHDVTVVNLNHRFEELNLYFVRADETIQSAQYKVQQLAQGQQQQVRVPAHQVALALTAITSQGNELLLEKTAPMSFEQGQHYLISLEHDPASPNDVKLRLLH